MTNLLFKWVISAAALFVVAYFVPGVSVSGVKSAFIAAAAIGLINATLGAVIKFFAWPARILTLGLASLVINALMLQLASAMLEGFHVSGFWPAFFGAIVLAIVNSLLRSVLLGD